MAACRLCAGRRSRRLDARGPRWLVRCADCGAVYDGRPVDAAALRAAYEQDAFFDQHLSHTGGEYAGERARIEAFGERQLRRLEGRGCGRELLDVGCSLGFFLEVARRRGFDARGLELSAGAIRWLGSRDLPVIAGDLRDDRVPAERFDVLTAWFVLEHVDDPATFLRSARRALRPGGLLALAVPNLGGLLFRLRRQRWLEERRGLGGHLVDFERRSLLPLLARCGFETIWTGSEGRGARAGPLLGLRRRLGLGNVLLVDALRDDRREVAP